MTTFTRPICTSQGCENPVKVSNKKYFSKYCNICTEKLTAANKGITIQELRKQYQEKVPKEKKAAYSKKSRQKKDISMETNDSIFIEDLYSRAKQGAKTRNIPFLLSKKQLTKLYKDSNKLCGLTNYELEQKRNSINIPSVDRISSDGNYQINNVQIVASHVNIAKNCYTQEQFDSMCIARANKLILENKVKMKNSLLKILN